MGKPQGVKVANCPNCSTPIGDRHPHTWCIECGNPLPAAIQALITHDTQPESIMSDASSVASQQSLDSSNSLVSALNFIGYANLIASILLAIYVWSSFGSVEVVAGTYSTHTEKVTNPAAIGMGIALITQGVIVLIFCLAISRILSHVAEIHRSVVTKQ
jgi:hypothetical protein